jgi:hypothetical protein
MGMLIARNYIYLTTYNINMTLIDFLEKEYFEQLKELGFEIHPSYTDDYFMSFLESKGIHTSMEYHREGDVRLHFYCGNIDLEASNYDTYSAWHLIMPSLIQFIKCK